MIRFGMSRIARTLLALLIVFPALLSGQDGSNRRIAEDFKPLDAINQLSSQSEEWNKEFQPWWQNPLTSRLSSMGQPTPITPESLVLSALQHSSQIRGFSDLPLIREQTIGEAEGEFDWRVFGETTYNSISDPVGNFLTTGGPDRFRESDFGFSGGMRRRNHNGGTFEVSQEFGLTDNNSNFFIPPNQGTSRLQLSYIQPLLRGAGVDYNTSQIYLAMLDTAAANQEFSRQLQSQVLEVTSAFWALYVERAALLQRVKLYQQSVEIFEILNKRRNLDVIPAQLLRAKSAVAERLSLLARSQAAVRNAESRIKALINDPYLQQTDNLELVPDFVPKTQFMESDITEAKLVAIENRPEIVQTKTQITASCRRRDMAQNEIQPYLNAVLETYVAGLRGNSNIGNAFSDQFSEGQPGYTVGLTFEYPLCNRTARSRLKRRELEIRQLQSQLQTTINTLVLEVEVAVREVQTSYTELTSKHLAMQANQAEVDAIRKRWEVLVGKDSSATLFLDNLLVAQVRLAASEKDLADALATYNLALINLSKAKGTLLQDQRIDIAKYCDECLPNLSAYQANQLGDENTLAPEVVPNH